MDAFRIVKNKDNPYVMVDKRPVENPSLSWGAKGLLVYLLSKPNGWEVRFSDLYNHAPERRSALRALLKELEDAGHIKREAMKGTKGIYQGIYEVHECPEGAKNDEGGRRKSPPGGGENRPLNNNESNNINTSCARKKDLLDAILEADAKSKGKGYLTLPEIYVPYARPCCEIGGLKFIQRYGGDWINTFNEWMELGFQPDDIEMAIKEIRKEGRILISRPGSITHRLVANQAVKKSGGGQSSSDRISATLKKIGG